MTMNNTPDLDELLWILKAYGIWCVDDRGGMSFSEARAKLQKLIVEAVISELEWLISWDNPDTLDKVTIKDRIKSLKGSVEEDK
jgi:hypothetical protein